MEWNQRRRGARCAVWSLIALALMIGALALSGCSLGSDATSGPPPDAATVLQRVQCFSVKDAGFKIHMEGTTSGTTITGEATAQVTTSPVRSDVIYQFTLDSQPFSFEVITDGATKLTYTYFTVPAQLRTGKRLKQPAQDSALNDLANFASWNDAPGLTMVGPDNVMGVSVWHLKGKETSGGISADDDIYVSQQDYRPVQAVVKTSGSDALMMTITYTSFNTGRHLDLPPDSRVQSA